MIRALLKDIRGKHLQGTYVHAFAAIVAGGLIDADGGFQQFDRIHVADRHARTAEIAGIRLNVDHRALYGVISTVIIR
jgi:hypothetical protein